MELDENTLDGHWSTNNNTGMDFFIINDAIFSKLCILGEDVEPCFEGSSITAPEVSTTFTKMDEDFKKTLFTMMQDLKHALKGGYEMELKDENVETEVTTEVAPNQETVETTETTVEEEVVVTEENDSTEDIANSIEATQSNEEETAAEEELVNDEVAETDTDNTTTVEEEVKDYSLLEQELETLKANYAEMETKYQELVAFKEAVDNEKKDALINSFYMLSDEDKKDVIENKSNYSLEEIESKLCVICVRKKVNFDLDNTEKNENTVEVEKVATYNLNNVENEAVPA